MAKKLTEKEKRDWENLYEYVKKLMGYDNNQSLSRDMVLRLKGLPNNKFMANKNIKSTANYSYEVVLNTFKYCYPKIEYALNHVDFKNEQHKFLYITKIVENNMNDVYIKMKNAEKTNKEIEDKMMSSATKYVNTFKKKEQKSNDKLDELW